VHGPNPCTHPSPPLSPYSPPSPPLFLPPFLPSPWGERGRKEGRKRGPRDSTLPFLFKGQPCPIFGQGRQIFALVYITQPTLPRDKKKPSGQHNFFSTTSNFFSHKGITLAHLPLKFQNFILVFDAVRAHPNSQKTHSGTLVL
jgi:hypothetical protein